MDQSGRLHKTVAEGDRFIPNRAAMDFDRSHHDLLKENNNGNSNISAGPLSPSCKTYASANVDASQGSKILAYKTKAPAPKEGYMNNLRVLYAQGKTSQAVEKKPTRHIPQAPERVLDAPELVDDYYLNLLDWSAGNQLAIALGKRVYLWNATTSSIDQLMECSGADNFVTSVSWTADGNYLAVGTNEADVQLWDTTQHKQLRTMRGHSQRVGALAWNGHILSSGSRDGKIFHHDVRIAQHHVATLEGHTQEVCGLKWSPDGSQLASGGNDNLLNIWDASSTAPKFCLDAHQAAVKAVAWCPWQAGLLASGGGTSDRCIRTWSSSTGACLNTVDTGSQVCALQWSPHARELVSSHGFSENQLIVWKYPAMVRMAELRGHTSRVLHLALSPDGTTIASAAGDETLRFWKVFEGAAEQQKKAAAAKKIDSHNKLSSISLR